MTAIPWHRRQERGSSLLTRFMIWLALSGGLAAAQALLYPIAAYFFLRPGEARAASRDYLQRALARRITPVDQFRHMLVFANVLLDRVLLSAKGSDGFHLDVIGLDHLTSAFAAGRGCILLGSHLGSFDVLRAFGRGSPVPVRALMHRDDRGQYSRLLEQLDPTLQDHVIQTGSGDSMLRVREALAGGEIVGVLADRAPSGGRAGRKSLAVPFLGQPAMFPTGPFLLIRHLDAPAVLFFGIRTGRRRYALLFEPFTPDGSLRQTITAYATRLADQCHAHPFNWFNFYPFWEPGPDASLSARDNRFAAAEPAGSRSADIGATRP